jgi:hypothetical protein
MEEFVQGVLLFLVAIVLGLGIFWLMWHLWCWVLPQIWADGPVNLVRPGYWLFVGAWVLASLVGGALFGRGKE